MLLGLFIDLLIFKPTEAEPYAKWSELMKMEIPSSHIMSPMASSPWTAAVSMPRISRRYALLRSLMSIRSIRTAHGKQSLIQTIDMVLNIGVFTVNIASWQGVAGMP